MGVKQILVMMVAFLVTVTAWIGCNPNPPENQGPLVGTLVGKKITFIGIAPDSINATNQLKVRIEYTFGQDGYIKAERIETPYQQEKRMMVIPGDRERYVVDGLNVKCWSVDSRELFIDKLFSFPKADVQKGDLVLSPELPFSIGKEKKMITSLFDQNTNVWVYAVE